ncbi:MAG: hypothetical protein MI723_14550 [Caulobacterales bacterium]|nr:hypothetical protein [Caulobacterales bacterium]
MANAHRFSGIEGASVLSRALSTARPFVEIALVLALAKLAAGFVWVGAPPSTRIGANFAVNVRAADTPARAVVDRSALTAYNPFQSGSGGTRPAQEQDFANAPETTLNLTITGIRAAGEGGVSVAYIMRAGGEIALVREGDGLSPGVEVLRILTDRVILRRDGREEVLRFRDERQPFSVDSGRRPSSREPSLRRVEPAPVEPDPAEAAVEEVAEPAEDPRLATLRGDEPASDETGAAAAFDPASLTAADIASVLEWRPVRSDGQLMGLAIFPRGDDGLFASTGLSPGDVVVEVNGVDVSDAAAFLGMLDDLESIDDLNVIVDRNGARERFSFALR